MRRRSSTTRRRPGSSAGSSASGPGTMGVCALIQNKYGIDAVPHVLCRGFTREETEDFLIELRYLGIDNVLAVRGDDSGYQKPLREGRSANRFASDLVAQIDAMNHGRYLAADLLDAEPSEFCVGVGRLSREALRGAEPRRRRAPAEGQDRGRGELRRDADVLRQPALLRLRRRLPRGRHHGADHPRPEGPLGALAVVVDPAQLLRRDPRRAGRRGRGGARATRS